MEEMIPKHENYPAILDGYVQQGRMFLFNAAQNLIQYGRVLTEAKPFVPRGQFESWVQSNFNMSERTAQSYMAVWKRFGKSEQFQNIQFSNLQKMLALPEGTEGQFAEENDVKNMTAREVERAVQKAKEEARVELQKEQTARKEAENRVLELERKEHRANEALSSAAIAEKNAEIEKYRAQAERFREEAEAAKNGQRNALAQLQEAKDDIKEYQEMLTESQQGYDRLQAELLNAKSTIAKGDAERVISEQLTAEDFSAAVRAFLGAVAQMPYMGATFSQMVDDREHRQWDELLQAVEDWAGKARKALNTVDQRGELIDG